jgi:hypothetical protein
VSSQILTVAILPQSCFLVLPNDLPEIFSGAETRCSIVVRVGDARVRVVQKRAAEIGVLAAADGGGGGGGGSKQMRAHVDTRGREGGGADHVPDSAITHGRAVVCGEPEG